MSRMDVASIRMKKTDPDGYNDSEAIRTLTEVCIQIGFYRADSYYSLICDGEHLYFYVSDRSAFGSGVTIITDKMNRLRFAAHFYSYADFYHKVVQGELYPADQRMIWKLLVFWTFSELNELNEFKRKNAGKSLNEMVIPLREPEEG